MTAGADGARADLANPETKLTIGGTALSADDLRDVLGWEVETVLGRPDSLELRFLLPMDSQGTPKNSGPASWKPGSPVKLEVAKVVLFEGEITSVDFEGGVDRPTEFVLLAFDKRHRLYRTETRKVLLDMTAGDVVSKLLSEAGLSKGKISGKLPTTVHKHQLHLGTAGDYLDRLCDQFGLTCVMVGGKVSILDSSELTEDAGVLSANVHLLDYRFRRTSSADLEKVVVTSWDPKQKKEVLGQAVRSQGLPAGDLVEPAKAHTAFNIQSEMKFSTLAPAQSDADKEALGALARNVDAGMQFEAASLFNPKAAAGRTVTIEHVPKPFAGKYRLTSVRHVFDLVEGHRTHLTSRGADDVTVTGLLGGAVTGSGASPPLDEKLHGVYPAIVTDIASDPASGAVAKDGAAGEVRVKMPWLDSQYQSAWMRVVTVGGGADRGLFVLPEINDEVLVAFEFGDPRRGYVIGGLYNGKDPAPRKEKDLGVAEGKVHHRVWRSKTGQEVLFSDKDGEVHLVLQDKTKKSFIKIDTTKKVISVESDAMAVKVKTDQTVDVEAKQNVTIKSEKDVIIEGLNVNVKAKTNLNLEATSNATLKGTAGAKVEGAKVDVTSQGPATVKGNPIMLN
jgi:uncharacterized protein involved in type VI secretion and phage assembly